MIRYLIELLWSLLFGSTATRLSVAAAEKAAEDTEEISRYAYTLKPPKKPTLSDLEDRLDTLQCYLKSLRGDHQQRIVPLQHQLEVVIVEHRKAANEISRLGGLAPEVPGLMQREEELWTKMESLKKWTTAALVGFEEQQVELELMIHQVRVKIAKERNQAWNQMQLCGEKVC
ncbi:hypothetical protein EDC01DRAFT_775666 [Geopyxis carbonaria]|nr:hypothetical protein EDC01DRAFT_775666 [Geopyxis carbonaria]